MGDGLPPGTRVAPIPMTLREKQPHLDPVLRYHVRLLEVLAGCAAGSKNINIVEAKLQQMYPLDHIMYVEHSDVLNGCTQP